MIPKKIHFCWLSGEPYTELVNYCLKTWKEKLPDYEIILWNLERFNINSSLWVQQAYSKKKYAFAADYIRLYALYHEGGIYLDSDVEVIKSFDALLNNYSFIGFDSTHDLEPGIIGSVAHCEWIKQCLDYYENRSFIKDRDILDTKPLPIIINSFLNEKLLTLEGKQLPYLIDDIYFCPSDYFSPKNMHSKKINKTINTITIHHFDGSWVDNNLINKIKKYIHLFIYKLFGHKNHKKIINFIRKFKKK